MTNYGRHINSFEWMKKAREVRRRSGGACERCGFIGKGIAAHHTKEAYKLMGTSDEVKYCEALCRRCHAKEHGINGIAE